MIVRSPQPFELVLLRRLLPRAAAEGPQRSFRVGMDGAGRVVGAVSWREYEGRTGDLQVRVVRPDRRMGIGRELVTAALGEEAARGSRRAEAWIDLAAHPEGEPFFHALGFATEDRLTTVEGDLTSMLITLTRIVERLRAGNRIPTGARVGRLADAPSEALARLYGDFLNRSPGFRADLFAARLVPEYYPYSTVVLSGAEVAGFLLVANEGNLAHIPTRIVAPGFRGSWVNPLMLLSSLELGPGAGVSRVRFDYWSDNRDTLRLAQRLQAGVVCTRVLLSRNLSPPSEPCYAPG